MRKHLRKFALLAFAFIFTLVFGITFLGTFNVVEADAENLGYESFYTALMNMKENFGTNDVVLDNDEYFRKDDEILVSATTAQKWNLAGQKMQDGTVLVDNVGNNPEKVVVREQPNRLIVTNYGKVNSYGACMKAEFEEVHIFQYADASQAQYAYEQLTNSGLTVSYDQVVRAQDLNTQEVEANYTNFEDKTFLSWGADYVDYQSYVVDMMSKHDTLNDVYVVVIDSGINTSHPLLKDRIMFNYGRNFVDEKSPTGWDFEDLNDHGSHVSGVIVDSTPENVKIIPLKVLDHNGDGYSVDIVSAIKYVSSVLIDQRGVDIKVMNMSIGLTKNGTDATLENQVRAIRQKGVFMVLSAGNSSTNTANACPANVDEAIVVSGLTQSGSKLVFARSYSNFGATVDFSAPGTSIYSSVGRNNKYGQYGFMSGTSMAAPHVTAAFALIFSNPTFDSYSLDEVETMLKLNAIDLGDEGFDVEFGYGCINLTDVGESRYGYVQFSSTNEFPTSDFNLTLSYSKPANASNAVIHYSFETPTGFVEDAIYQPGSSIRISQSTKITVYAEIIGSQFTKSYETTQTYYFNDIDVPSNFVFYRLLERPYLTIGSYQGKLSTLRVPQSYNSLIVAGVEQEAFNSSKVENLILPSSTQSLSNRAFYLNTTIKSVEIEDQNVPVEIGDYAFYRCTHLETINIPQASVLGDYSFAYCKNLNTLKVFNIKEIGMYALSASGVTDLYVGQKLETFEKQSSLSLKRIYGLGKNAASVFATDNAIPYVDLTMKITQNLNTQMYAKNGDTVTLILKYRGLDVVPTVTGISSFTSRITNDEGDGFDFTLTITFRMNASTQNVQVKLTDQFNTAILSNLAKIKSYSNDSDVRALNFSESDSHYSVWIKNELMQENQLISATEQYEVTVVAEAGQYIDSLKLNGVSMLEPNEKPISKTFSLQAGTVANIEVVTNSLGELKITFNSEHGKIEIVSGKMFGDNTVNNGETVEFIVLPEQGWEVQYVQLDGSILSSTRTDENGNKVYRVRNITKNMQVDVGYVEGSYSVTVYIGKGGTYIVGNYSNIKFTESRRYVISARDGYKIDFVTVNGKKVAVENNSFVLSKVDHDCEIVISFKKTHGIFTGGSMVLAYFIVFAILFVTFIVAKIVLHIIRKKYKKT